MAVLHVPLLAGGGTAALAFIPARFADGEWWRLFTHPFVHVSWYHLLLDGGAFLILWHGLVGNLRSRLGVLAASAAGSLLAAAIGSSEFWSLGLCGLSGIAHGLMAQQGLELARANHEPRERRLGLALFGGVLLKCLVEAAAGSAVFSSLHFGPIGTPIVICHLGGACGAFAWHFAERLIRARRAFAPFGTAVSLASRPTEGQCIAVPHEPSPSS